jgi:hypothetical protein
MLAAAVGVDRRVFISIVFDAVIAAHGLDVQVGRSGKDFELITTEAIGELVVAEHRLPIIFDKLPEVVKLSVLKSYMTGVLEGLARWRRRTVGNSPVVGSSLARACRPARLASRDGK